MPESSGRCYRPVIKDALVDFLLERLGLAAIDELDGHEPARFMVGRDLPNPPKPWEKPYDDRVCCVVCTRPMVPSSAESLYLSRLIEPWPCPPVRVLAARFREHPGYRSSWRPES